MSEERCYALAIPIDEMWDYWMKKNDRTFRNLKGCVGIHPTEQVQYLLFRDPEDRKEAYKKIHEAYPETLCAYEMRVMYVDKQYINEA